MVRTLLIAAIFLVPAIALADWRIGPGSEIFFGTSSAFVEMDRGGALGILCREGQPLLWTQGWAPATGGADREEQFSMVVDGQAFLLSGTHTPPDGMWTATPPTALIAALKAGRSATIEIQSLGRATTSLSGSSRTIDEALSNCGAPSTDTPTGERSIVIFDQQIAAACGGGYQLAEGAELSGRLDGDDRPDFVLNWGGVTCDDRTRGRGAGFCGAALCTIDILLTETGERKQVLGVNPIMINRAFGLQALQTTTQGATCGGPAQVCDLIWIWNDAQLEPQE